MSLSFKNFFLNPDIILLDVRHQKDFIKTHIPKSIFIGLNGSFAPWVGSIIGDTNKKIILITPKGKENEAVTRLSRVGFDNCLGYLKGGVEKWEKDGNSVSSLESIKAKNFIDVLKLNKINILDVRKESEYSTKHIEGATNIPLRLLSSRFQEVKVDENLYVHCAGGYRSVIAISILRKKGYSGMININEGFNEILKSDLNENCYNSFLEASCDNM